MKGFLWAMIIFGLIAAAGLVALLLISMDVSSPTGQYVYWHTFSRADGGSYRHYSKEIHIVEKSQPLQYGYMQVGGSYYTYQPKYPIRYAYTEAVLPSLGYSQDVQRRLSP